MVSTTLTSCSIVCLRVTREFFLHLPKLEVDFVSDKYVYVYMYVIPEGSKLWKNS